MNSSSPFVVAEVKSTTGVVLDSLRQAILVDDLPGGMQPKQNAIAAEFSVSVAPIREALHRLVASGLATLSPNRGVTVAVMSEGNVIDISKLRALLEPHAFKRSAPRLTEANLADAESILRAASGATDAAQRAELHWKFHLALLAKADRQRLLAQIEALYVSMSRYWCPAWNKVGLSANWVDIHLDIVEAVRRGHVNAAV